MSSSYGNSKIFAPVAVYHLLPPRLLLQCHNTGVQYITRDGRRYPIDQTRSSAVQVPRANTGLTQRSDESYLQAPGSSRRRQTHDSQYSYASTFSGSHGYGQYPASQPQYGTANTPAGWVRDSVDWYRLDQGVVEDYLCREFPGTVSSDFRVTVRVC